MNPFLKKFIREKFKKPGKALDLGAGSFSDVCALKDLGWECEGVDKSTGIDLNFEYSSTNAPFDLVYSCYVLHFIKNKKQFIDNADKTLKTGGWLYLLIMHEDDQVVKSGVSEKTIRELLASFINIKVNIFDFYDKDPGHLHWHKIMEVAVQKK